MEQHGGIIGRATVMRLFTEGSIVRTANAYGDRFPRIPNLLVKQHVHCEQRESISVNGVSHPVQTYQVIELVNASVRKDTKLEKVIPGLSLAFDPSSL